MPQQVPLVAGHGRTEVKRLHYIATHAVKHPKHEHVSPQNVRSLVARLGSGTHVIQYRSMYVPIYRNTEIVLEIYVGTLAGVENLQIDTVTRQ